jgi:hypothetical protein
MKEYILRRGYESTYKYIEVPWYFWLFMGFGFFYEIKSFFIDLINEEGKVRRIYEKSEGGKYE